MCDEDHIEGRQVHSPDDRESPPAPAEMVGVMGRGHRLGGLISGDTSGPLLHKINMTLFCLFWRGFYPF